MIPKWDLKSCSPIVEMSTPSTTILPLAGSTRRNRAPMRVVFPLPVRPTMPILWPPSKVQLIPCRTSGASGLESQLYPHLATRLAADSLLSPLLPHLNTRDIFRDRPYDKAIPMNPTTSEGGNSSCQKCIRRQLRVK